MDDKRKALVSLEENALSTERFARSRLGFCPLLLELSIPSMSACFLIVTRSWKIQRLAASPPH